MHWFWMNIPLGAMIFAIWTGVPLWLVLKHPDISPGSRVPDPDPGARVPDPAPGARIPDPAPGARVPDPLRPAQAAL
jgi:hypothetical protein